MASNIEIKALGEANLPDNNTEYITPEKLREVFVNMLDHLGGMVYKEQTPTNPIENVTGGIETQIVGTFDGYSVMNYRPYYIDSDYIFNGGIMQLRDVQNASLISVRVENRLVVPSNTEVDIIARFKDSTGAQVFDINVESLYFKNAKTITKTSNFILFMDDDIEGGTMELYVESDNDMQVFFKSILIDIR